MQWGVNLASVEWRNNEHIDPSHAVDNRHDIERHTTPGAAPTHTRTHFTGHYRSAGTTLGIAQMLKGRWKENRIHHFLVREE